jgi:hypothetical protein
MLVLVSACGSESADSVASLDSPDADDSAKSENSMIVANDNVYVIDDFTSAGYKAVTHFDLDTLPEANDAWYGFYSQKDFELRFYESHEAALEHGLESAEIAVGKGAVGYSKQPPLRFDAYAIVGNVVMLCELALESCESLIAELSE